MVTDRGGVVYDSKGIAPTICCGDKTYAYILVRDMQHIPMLIHKDMGVGSSQNLGIEVIGNEVASCLCARDYKGISRKNANAVIVLGDNVKEVLGFNLDADGVSVRGLKAQYQKNSASNFCRSGSYGASAVMEVIDSYNKRYIDNTCVGTLTTYGNTNLSSCGTFLIKGGDEVEDKIRIRKLTPKECWLLQGWDDESFQKAKNAGVSDSQLYKQAGNGVSVNIIETIGRALKKIELEEQE